MSGCFEAFGEATSEHTAVIARCWNEAGSGTSGAEAKGKQRAVTASPARGAKSLSFEVRSRAARNGRTKKLNVFAKGGTLRVDVGKG
ncbi:MAG: hypothetical protein WA183_08805 [Chthoniobacterales bacterium]